MSHEQGLITHIEVIDQAAQSPDARSLRLGFSLHLNDRQHVSRVLEAIAVRIPALEQLDLGQIYCYGEDDFSAFILDCSNTRCGDGDTLLSKLVRVGLVMKPCTDKMLTSIVKTARDGHLHWLWQLFIADARLSANVLKKFGEVLELGSLPQLEWFQICGMKASDLIDIPDQGLLAIARAAEKGYLSNIRKLGLGNTPLSDRTLGVFMIGAKKHLLPNLRQLYICDTDVTDKGLRHIAEAAKQGGLSSLRVLSFRQNENVTDLGLRNLAKVGKKGFKELTSLECDCPLIRGVDQAVVSTKNPDSIFDAAINGKSLHVARIMLLGSGGVGKTWLRRRVFQGKQVGRSERRRETRGIDFLRPEECKWIPKITSADGTVQSVEPRVWDFAGQLVAQGVHESFLSNDGRSVCIVVLDATRPPGSFRRRGKELGNQLGYWLKTIAHYAGPQVPNIIAITQCDDVDRENRPIDVPLDDLRLPVAYATREDISSIFNSRIVKIIDDCSACDPRRPLKPLRQAIELAIGQLSIMNDAKVPEKLIPLRKKVEELLRVHPFVHRSVFASWCKVDEVGIETSAEVDSYLRILHHLGCAFYFGMTACEQRQRDLEGTTWFETFPPGRQRLLAKRISESLTDHVINPEWLKLAVYSLVQLSEQKAWITRADVARHVAAANRLLQKANSSFVPNTQGADVGVVDDFLELVDMSFFDRNSGDYLFPRGLPKGPPPGTDRWARRELRWQYFPETAIHRFIVQMHARNEIVGEAGSDGHWRDAVLMEHPRGSRAAIVANATDGVLQIRFDPTSPIHLRADTSAYVKALFTHDLIGTPPIMELEILIKTDLDERRSEAPDVALADVKENLRNQLVLTQNDGPRIEQVEKLATRLLGTLTTADREFIRLLFGRTRKHNFGGDKGRLGFRAAYFYYEFIRPALTTITLKSKLPSKFTWDIVYRILEGKVPALMDGGWELFGDPLDRPKSLGALRKSLSRDDQLQMLQKQIDAVNPYAPNERCRISDNESLQSGLTKKKDRKDGNGRP